MFSQSLHFKINNALVIVALIIEYGLTAGEKWANLYRKHPDRRPLGEPVEQTCSCTFSSLGMQWGAGHSKPLNNTLG